MQNGNIENKGSNPGIAARLGEVIYDVTPRPRLLREGLPRIAFVLGLTLLLFLVRSKSKLFATLCQVSVYLSAFLAFFYRNPARETGNATNDYIYAPSDGKVIAVDEVEEPRFIGGRAHRVIIESNVLATHLHRAPSSGQLRYIFNEPKPQPRIYLGIAAANGDKVLLVLEQKSNLISLPSFITGTRPVSLQVEAGSNLTNGQPIGVDALGFGSRIILYLPATPDIHLFSLVGMPVRAGMSIIARFYPK